MYINNTGRELKCTNGTFFFFPLKLSPQIIYGLTTWVCPKAPWPSMWPQRWMPKQAGKIWFCLHVLILYRGQYEAVFFRASRVLTSVPHTAQRMAWLKLYSPFPHSSIKPYAVYRFTKRAQLFLHAWAQHSPMSRTAVDQLESPLPCPNHPSEKIRCADWAGAT